MSRIILPVTAALLALGTLAVAHTGVTNPAVMARMENMKQTQESTKLLGQMAKGDRAFDADEARAALAEIARHAAETPDLFEARESDPQSEALPVIWDDFEAFTEASYDLEAIARDLSATLETQDDLRNGLRRVGSACKACHERYRE